MRIAIVGKYTNLLDSYKSLAEALTHGGIANRVRVRLDWVDSEDIRKAQCGAAAGGRARHPGAGGFGERGTEGKIAAVRFARERGVPFFGICFGMQMAVIEAARNLAGMPDASSTEFGPCDDAGGRAADGMGARQRDRAPCRGRRPRRHDAARCLSGGAGAEGSLVRSIYGDAPEIDERHRHRYEVNVHYRESLEATGMRFSGMSPDGVLPEIVELPDHPWFVGVQFHPELKSKPFDPHPLFRGFIARGGAAGPACLSPRFPRSSRWVALRSATTCHSC